ncbi:fumarylacetoacetate hydrolase family protein [Falsibacillus pallidus]|uniref:fumarylacetoacetate hydrolase family protein n=1 Tax=Falsibacillus pallidus TaxID=493781 RepID=UPI003D996FF5
MKFVSYKMEENESFSLGVVSEDETYFWNLKALHHASSKGTDYPETMLHAIQKGETFINEVNEWINFGKSCSKPSIYQETAAEAIIGPPIPRPPKHILCVGKNYREHALELGTEADIPTDIMMFTKPPTSIIGQGDSIDPHPSLTEALDYEGELAVVIGTGGRNISREDALKHVFGYTIINDVTARDLQARHKQFFIGKSLDTFCPMGPWIVHSSVITDPHSLNIKTKVNGEIRQDSNTEHFIFPIDEIISVLSRGMTLEPGDIIATGTPAGVGKGFKPPRYLKSGDTIEVEIEGIGVLHNIVKE